MTIEDMVLTEGGVDPKQAAAEQALRCYLRAPRGFNAEELLALVAWLDDGSWIALPSREYAEQVDRAERRGAWRVRERMRCAA